MEREQTRRTNKSNRRVCGKLSPLALSDSDNSHLMPVSWSARASEFQTRSRDGILQTLQLVRYMAIPNLNFRCLTTICLTSAVLQEVGI